jgi:hypothetical protein
MVASLPPRFGVASEGPLASAPSGVIVRAVAKPPNYPRVWLWVAVMLLGVALAGLGTKIGGGLGAGILFAAVVLFLVANFKAVRNGPRGYWRK